MTAKELQFGVEGIRLTLFEKPRRMRSEAAEQQCSCGIICVSECPMYCGGECDSECWDRCGGDEVQQATLVSSPHALTRFQTNTALSVEMHSYELS